MDVAFAVTIKSLYPILLPKISQKNPSVDWMAFTVLHATFPLLHSETHLQGSLLVVTLVT